MVVEREVVVVDGDRIKEEDGGKRGMEGKEQEAGKADRWKSRKTERVKGGQTGSGKEEDGGKEEDRGGGGGQGGGKRGTRGGKEKDEVWGRGKRKEKEADRGRRGGGGN